MDHKNDTISETFNRGINKIAYELYYIINPFDSFIDKIIAKLKLYL